MTTRTRWLALGTLAFAIRFAAAIATGGLAHPEVNEYDSLARSLVAGQGFVYWHIGVPYYAYAPPLDAWLAAGSYWLAGSLIPLMMLQCAAGAAGAVAAAAVTTRLTTLRHADLAAGLLVAVHPGLVVYTATKSHPLVFDALFFTLTLLCTMRLAEQMTTGRAATLGAVVGLGALSRGTIVIFLPVAGLWLLLTSPRDAFKTIVTRMVVAGVVATTILAPWVVRSSMLHDRFVFILTTDSEDFWRGNNPWATGHSYAASGQPVVTSIPPAELADLQAQPDELSQARWFSTRARAFVRENPGAFVRLTLKKFHAFWWFAPQTGVLYSNASLRLYQVYYVGVLILAAIGTVMAFGGSAATVKKTWLLLAFLLILSGLQSLYYVEGRHRWAVEPMLLALSGCGAAALLARATGRSAAARP